jgi:1-deoxy-D-xylulose 5-phosphate reductoisomerase
VAVARFLAGTLDFPGIARLLEAAVVRSTSGSATGPAAPDLDQLVELDTDIRAAFATGPIGGIA